MIILNDESANSEVLTSAIGKSNWIPVAAIDQVTVLTLKSGKIKLSISEEALANHLDSWKGGYINVNHQDNGEIDIFEIEDAKFEDGMLYHKVSSDAADFIRNTASSGRSIEIKPLQIVDNKVIEYTGLGLSVLYPPFTPACGPEMGCSSSGEQTGPVKDIFTKLAHKLKSHSSMNEDSGTENNPNLETTNMDDIEKLTSARIEAEHSRDEALKKINTLKSSLVDKDKSIEEKDKLISENATLVTDRDKTISEQTDKLKSYADAEAAAAEKLKDDQWEILKSNIPPGKVHKQEDADILKQEFLADPASFAVKMASWKLEDPTGESGSEFPPSASMISDTEIAKGISALGIPNITFEGGK